MSNINRTDKTNVHIVIPDSHATSGHDNRRYEWLGHLINDINGPDTNLTVTDIGDWWDMPSLNKFDNGAKKAYEGREYKKDIEAGLDAQDRMFSIIRRQKRKLPRFVRTLGNHEERINKAIGSDPVLRNTISTTHFQSKEYGWEEFNFLEPVDIDGVQYAHYFVTGVSGRPISGDRTAGMLLQKQFKSSTQGHSHLFDYAVRTNASGSRLQSCVVGCYVEDHLDWADATANMWWSGVVIKRNVADGEYDLQTISIEALKKAYGT